jgi:DNA polymerase-1
MYENMQLSNVIVYDIETYDPDLIKMGPGVFRSIPLDFKNPNGYILGYSVLDEYGNKGYYNLGHYDCTPELRQKNIKYLKEIMSNPDTILIGQNLIYDLDWTQNWLGIKVCGHLIDTMIAEALLDENQGYYNLDFMGNKYFKEGKKKTIIDRFCEENGLKGDPRKWLYKMPHYMVEEYAIGDVDLPMRIWRVQESKLIEEDLLDLMHLECDLLQMLILMRKTGTRIDKKQRELNAYELQSRTEEIYFTLIDQLGHGFNYNSSPQVAKILDRFGIPYPLTEKKNPSVKREHLQRLAKGQLEYETGEYTDDGKPIIAKITDPIKCKLGEDLSDIRRADKVLKTFLHGSLVRFITEGDLIHSSFYNTRREDYGTRSGRFSCANPNLQQIPSLGVDEYYGRLSRNPFIPFDNCWWGKLDYSQVEYRFMAHFARGPGSIEVRAQYNNNPRTDFHQYIMDLTGLKRRYAKNLNFGVAYGMGAAHMADFFQWDLDYCYNILNIYHNSAPFIKSTMRKVSDLSLRRGYIRTFLRRRSRLIDPDKAYTMFCRLIQGSAADLMKKGMYDTYKAGIFNILPPHLTVHDEIDVSIPKTKEAIEAFVEAKHIMESCLTLKVPIIADMEVGPNWADVKKLKGDLKFCNDELNKMLKEV